MNINELKKSFDERFTAIALINALPSSLNTVQTILGNTKNRQIEATLHAL
jgi:hypothetical protein